MAQRQRTKTSWSTTHAMPKTLSAKEAVKASVLALLKDSYGIEEEDFLSAELEIVLCCARS